MSQENVEIVRQALLASSSGDFTDFEAMSDPAIEWDMSGVTGWVEQEVYRGLQSWEEWHFEVEELQDVEGQAFGGIHERAKSAATGVTVDQRRYFVNTLRDGRMLRISYVQRAAGRPRRRGPCGVGGVAGVELNGSRPRFRDPLTPESHAIR